MGKHHSWTHEQEAYLGQAILESKGGLDGGAANIDGNGNVKSWEPIVKLFNERFNLRLSNTQITGRVKTHVWFVLARRFIIFVCSPVFLTTIAGFLLLGRRSDV